MSDDKNKIEEKSPGPNRPAPRESNARSPKAAIVWLVIMLIIGSLFFFKGFGASDTKNISQSQFESMLKDRQIATAVLVSEGDKVFTIEGVLKSDPAAAQPKKKNAREKRYRTRVVYTESLNSLLSLTNVQVDSNNAGLWNFLLFALLPVVVIVGMIYFFSARQMRGNGAMEFGRSRARMIPPNELNVRFDDIAGADEAKEEIDEEYLKMLEGLGNDQECCYLIPVFKDSLERVGTCSFMISEDKKVYDIAYCVHKKYWRQGYATEIAQGMIDYARSQGAEKVTVFVSQENAASNRVAQKCGGIIVSESTYKKRGADSVLKDYKYEIIL